MRVTFVRTRTEYATYVDYWKLVELSGFPTCYLDEIPTEGVRDNAYIITPFNGEWVNGVVTDGRVIGWDLEYRREPQAPIPGVSGYWHMDKWQAEMLGYQYVPVGGHAGLRPDTIPAPSEPFDVAYLAYMTHRRQRVYNELQGRGVRLSSTSAWGEQRHAILSASRVYLHVHQHDDIPAVPGLRLVVAAAYHLPFITEQCADYGRMERRCIKLAYADIAPRISEWNAPDMDGFRKALRDQGETLHWNLCHELTFRKSVEAAL